MKNLQQSGYRDQHNRISRPPVHQTSRQPLLDQHDSTSSATLLRIIFSFYLWGFTGPAFLIFRSRPLLNMRLFIWLHAEGAEHPGHRTYVPTPCNERVSSHSAISWSASNRASRIRSLPCCLISMSPHSVRILICCEMAGLLTSKFSAMAFRLRALKATSANDRPPCWIGYRLEYISLSHRSFM